MEFEVNGRNYRASKMDAMTQFNVIRKLAPIMEPLAKFVKNQPSKLNGETTITSEDIQRARTDAIDATMPIIKAIADLPEETTDYVIATCMNLVRRDEGQGRGWAKVWNDQAHRPQMDDIDMVTMLMIVVQVLGGSFSAFFPASGWLSETPLGNPSASIQ
jgi:hypothetical protein